MEKFENKIEKDEKLNEKIKKLEVRDLIFTVMCDDETATSSEKCELPWSEITYSQWQDVFECAYFTRDNQWEERAAQGLMETFKTEKERINAGQIYLLTTLKFL